MAVVQISKIQLRRGKANSGTGFPQLASGEMGWAVDTQELYIGNGSVAEGAPAVGNTKILTQNDFTAQGSILNLIQYIYKAGDPTITTGPDANSAIERPLLSRLSDRVTTADFGAYNDGTHATETTEALQRAIDQLFLNSTTKASADTAAGASTRVVLEMLAGRYVITNTIYIPSYATIIGAGLDKTIIEFTGTGPVFQFIDDASTAKTPATSGTYVAATTASTLLTTQPRFITIKGLTVFTDTDDQTALQLDSVRDSLFEDIKVVGSWGGIFNVGSKGITMTAVSNIVTCENNKFNRLYIEGFSYGVYATHDILNNTFENSYIGTANTTYGGLYQGFVLGENITGNVGQQFGPRETQISRCKFHSITNHAVIVENGTANTVVNCELTNVGNGAMGNIANHANAIYPQIYFDKEGNSCINVRSDRPAGLANDNTSTPYVPEVSGHGVTYSLYGTRNIDIAQATSTQPAFRLPVSTGSNGLPEGSINYSIGYLFKTTNIADPKFSRRGTITIVADIDASVDSPRSALVQLTDEYDYAGKLSEEDSIKLDFTVTLVDQLGITYTGALGQTPYSIVVNYTNPAGESGLLTYTYTAVI